MGMKQGVTQHMIELRRSSFPFGRPAHFACLLRLRCERAL